MKKDHNPIRKYFPVFVLPTLLCFFMFFAVPFLMGIGLSFTKFTTVTDITDFVGFKNYIKAFTADNEFVHALGFTSLFTIVSIVTVNVFARFGTNRAFRTQRIQSNPLYRPRPVPHSNSHKGPAFESRRNTKQLVLLDTSQKLKPP